MGNLLRSADGDSSLADGDDGESIIIILVKILANEDDDDARRLPEGRNQAAAAVNERPAGNVQAQRTSERQRMVKVVIVVGIDYKGQTWVQILCVMDLICCCCYHTL